MKGLEGNKSSYAGRHPLTFPLSPSLGEIGGEGAEWQTTEWDGAKKSGDKG
jgi:hypothetical protein